MLPLLEWLPAMTSAVFGPVYLAVANARPAFKLLGVTVFSLAVYLQFFSRHSLAGLLLQIAVACYLALWRRIRVSRS